MNAIYHSSYIFHDLHIGASSDHAEMLRLLNCLIGPFGLSDTNQATKNKSALKNYRLEFKQVASDEEISTPSTAIWTGKTADGHEMEVHDTGETRTYLLPNKAAAELQISDNDNQRGTCLIRYITGYRNIAAYACLVPTLADFLAHEGHFMMHAAAIAPAEGEGATIFFGPCGRGKTTAALSTLKPKQTDRPKQIQKLVCDDACLLTLASGKLRMWGLPRDCKLSENTVQMLKWPRKLPFIEGDHDNERRIRYLDMPTHDPHSIFTPKTLVFLDKRNDSNHEVTPMQATDTLAEILKLNLRCPDLAAMENARNAFGCFSQLASGARAYKISAGPDIAKLGKVLTELT